MPNGGVGAAIYISHLFTLLGTADVGWWWLRPAACAARPARVGWALHGFLFFMVFHATVVYEQGFLRWAGLACPSGWRRWCWPGALGGGPAHTTEGRSAELS